MKKLIFGLALLFFLPELIFATHYMGGEITWECMIGPQYTAAQQGNYRFHLKLYRECYLNGGGSASTFGGTESILTNVPGFATINMTLKSGWPKDISPKCFTDSLSVKCTGMAGANANMGAMQEYYYTSDVAYPNGIQFNGVPPATGWIFYNSSCCRNPSTNVTNSSSFGYRVRAMMYSYNGQNSYPCFDNSPTFAERPKPVMCTQFPILFNHNATDKDRDSLLFEWGRPLTDAGANLTFAPGYAYDNPLPNLTQNPLNVPAVMNPATGEITLKPVTTGAFVTSTKVTTYKNGIKTAEIWRDAQMVLRDCGSSNSPFIFFLDSNQTKSLVKNVVVGDSLQLSIYSSDTGQVPRLASWAEGSEFGVFTSGNPGSYSINGCLFYPCASLSNAGTIVQPNSLNPNISIFKWNTSSGHIPNGKNSESYYFNFYASNLACPVPVLSFAKLRVNVWRPYQLTAKPILNSAEVINTYGDVKLNFNIPADDDSAFSCYEIYYSQLATGPYYFAGNLNNYNSNTYIHRISQSVNTPLFYKIRVKDYKNGFTLYTEYSNPVQSSFLNLSVDSMVCIHPVSGELDVILHISNKGTKPVSNFTIRYDIPGSLFNSFNYVGTLNAGGTLIYPFTTTSTIDTAEFSVCGMVLHPKDFSSSDNMFCSQYFTSFESLFSESFLLEQNRPNPTNGKTEFNFTLPLNGEVVFELKNVLGQVVFSSKEKYAIGKNSISLDLSTYSPGLYFYSINMLGNTQTKKMVIK